MNMPAVKTPSEQNDSTEFTIAIIGMAARFPGADTLDEFWENIAAGRESVRPVSDQEFLAAGGDPTDLHDPHLVRMASVIDGIDRFDDRFFSYSPTESELIDPQQRLLLETSYHAMEDAGYANGYGDRLVGVYAGASDSRYYSSHIHPRFARHGASASLVHAAINNSLGTLATRISYELGLTGPSLSLQTTCSTALVALHTACQDLLDFRCDLALTGAASLNPSAMLGYRYVPDGPFSPDGRCRTFDAAAAGTSSGDGVGAVVLKRLDDALADGDHIRALIRGSAINNDGRRKVGFTAPSQVGQTEVILSAQAAAGITADSISYIEAHGTATRLGDPIEIAALTEAFRETTDQRGFCKIGSVKTNIGHLGAASGIAGIIKTVLALENRQIPPNLHFDAANPLIDFADTPFLVATKLEDWLSPNGPRRAAVSAFGVGGTNAHVVLEEAPVPLNICPPQENNPRWQVLPLSSHTPEALRKQSNELAQYLETHPKIQLDDIAHTLQTFRPAMQHRVGVTADTTETAARILRSQLPMYPEVHQNTSPTVTFLFPGGGTQYPGMGAQLYRENSHYRDSVDLCAEILSPVIGGDIRAALNGCTRQANMETFLALVVAEYSLAIALMNQGIKPGILLGHSLGEYVAATISGVMSIEDMLPLVAKRIQLGISAGGSTIAVALSEEELGPYLGDELSLAAVNGPQSCAVAGHASVIDSFEKQLIANGVMYRRLEMPVAAHSHVLDPFLDTFAAAFDAVTLNPPLIPIITNVTGTWLTNEQATSPQHWLDHARHTVRFSDSIATSRRHSEPIFVEVGPGDVLSKLAGSCLKPELIISVSTMRHVKDTSADGQVLANAIGKLWALGVDLDLGINTDQDRAANRIRIPSYTFDRRSHWIDAPAAEISRSENEHSLASYITEPVRTPRPPLGTVHIAPRTPHEKIVAMHWENILDIEGIGVHDNFFEIGGDSMRALMLTNRLREANIIDIPVAAILNAPTIAGMLSQAAGDGDSFDAFSPVLPLRIKGTGRALFCVHPVGGISWRYSGLLPHLDESIPVYGIQAYGLDGIQPLAASAGEMVDCYLKHLRSIQPHGPYRLLGWSFGGTVAYAMATKLQSEGEQIEVLALLDAPVMQADAFDEGTVDNHIASLLLRVAEVAIPESENTLDVPMVIELLAENAGNSAVSSSEAEAIVKVVRNNLRIAPEFIPSSFQGNVLFFSAAGSSAISEVEAGLDPTPAKASDVWREYVDGNFEEYTVNCDHYSMTDPEPVSYIGSVLATALNSANDCEQENSIT
ncbi:type I polyketide synthase [Rhodococcus sp. BH5]|uniref:type I polyketide synthase n=1 Tax=Rhodococcus sp. BH5 TaxID=2871702 RepID=UPI0022CDA79E|nr:beta-ketoacyl synthase N-terminal-like domain-containing protein [Rhodococcus sp. BH5]MCZ9634915.1 acyltransferase domain-containing protein [Rhodococcus sp. BH5]